MRLAFGRGSCVLLLLIAVAGALVSNAQTQTSPVPLVYQPLVPGSAAPGGPAFTLTVNGTGFVSTSAVKWNGSPRTTTFVSSRQLRAAIPATDIATATTAVVTVLSPGPGGGTSNLAYFEITQPTTSVGMSGISLAAGNNPLSVATGDFNGDGKLDLAIVNSGDKTVSVLLGKGDGTFLPHVDYATGANPQGVLAGDFNNDGILDLAVVNHDSNTVSILLGNGDGTLKAHIDSLTGTGPSQLTAGDFNGDGNLDLVVGNITDDTFSVLLGRGDGTFLPRADNSVCGFTAPATSIGIAAGDFNGDGKLDLAVVPCNGTVGILLGKGDGTFIPQAKAFFAGTNPATLVVADFNGDGKLDLGVGLLGVNGGAGAAMLFGNGDGTFSPPLNVTRLAGPS